MRLCFWVHEYIQELRRTQQQKHGFHIASCDASIYSAIKLYSDAVEEGDMKLTERVRIRITNCDIILSYITVLIKTPFPSRSCSANASEQMTNH